MSIDNRPGLSALSYRVGTHALFFEAMKARLATMSLNDGLHSNDGVILQTSPLSGLTTRNDSDPAIAFLDAWAVIADVLTFYQERIANEGFLRTASERRSILELAALVGYELRPGVSSSVYLAYGVQDLGGDQEVHIPEGSRVQSMAESGKLPQSFETSQPLVARASWNKLTPRLTRPQRPDTGTSDLYFKGVSTNLKPNDPLLMVTGLDAAAAVLRRTATVEPQFDQNRTKVTLQPLPPAPVAPGVPVIGTTPVTTTLKEPPPLENAAMLDSLAMPPAQHPHSAVHLVQDVRKTLSPSADAAPQLLAMFRPALRSQLYDAIENAEVAPPVTLEIHAFRVRAAPFGNNAPLEPVFDDKGKLAGHREWTLQRSEPTQTEEFVIETTFQRAAATATGLVIHVGVDIAHNGLVWGDNGGLRETFEIQYPEPKETVKVTVHGFTQTERNAADKVGLTFSFHDRRIDIGLSAVDKNGEADVEVSAIGCDPVTVVGRGATSLRNLGHDFEGANAPLIRITGTTRLGAKRTITEDAGAVSLDAPYDKVTPDSWLLIARPDLSMPLVRRAKSVSNESRADYGLTGKTTKIVLDQPWLGLPKPPLISPTPVEDENFATVIRGSTVFAESEQLELVDAPVADPVLGDLLELDGIQGGLEPGRWLIVTGERTDVPGTSGIKGTELVMLAGVDHGVASEAPGERSRSVLRLASGLAYQYKRDTISILGNVAHATHGETHTEVLGSGDGSEAAKQFALRQSPLTYVSAPTTTGVMSSLQLRVNDVLWHEVDRLNDLGPNDRNYITREADDSTTRVLFGNGLHGARVPTGAENVRAVYRTGLGASGNVPAGKISLLASRPLGVNAVSNPMAATGGADREDTAQARRNAPRGLVALDRLLSVADYADFAQAFAGVGKASATRIPVGHQQMVHVSVAGTDESPLEASSDLCRNLTLALNRFGDPYQPVLVTPGEAVLLVIVAKVRVDPDYLWEKVSPAVRAALLAALRFEQRDFGQDVALSEVISIVQGVPGVRYVDVDRLDCTTAATLMDDLKRISATTPEKTRPAARIRARLARVATHGSGVARSTLPAQVVYLSDVVPNLLTLTELV